MAVADPPGVADEDADRKATQPSQTSRRSGVLRSTATAVIRRRQAHDATAFPPACCWSPVRRTRAAGPVPSATPNHRRIANLNVRRAIRGRNAESAGRPPGSGAGRSLLAWKPASRQLALISQKTKLAEAIRYALSRWNGLNCRH